MDAYLKQDLSRATERLVAVRTRDAHHRAEAEAYLRAEAEAAAETPERPAQLRELRRRLALVWRRRATQPSQAASDA